MGPSEGFRSLAILLAIAAAVALAYGAHFQNAAVVSESTQKTKSQGALSWKQLVALVARPKWLSGTAFMAAGIILQLASLSLAPLIVVQPVGAVALVITSLLNARSTMTDCVRFLEYC